VPKSEIFRFWKFAVLMAELSAGPYATADGEERARRQARLQFIESMLTPIPFDADCARAYGLVFAAVAAAGRKPRGARAVDLMIAATSVSLGLPLFTRNAVDFAGLEGLATIISVPQNSVAPDSGSKAVSSIPRHSCALKL
jgi:predicted nucleic acid-binding protein